MISNINQQGVSNTNIENGVPGTTRENQSRTFSTFLNFAGPNTRSNGEIVNTSRRNEKIAAGAGRETFRFAMSGMEFREDTFAFTGFGDDTIESFELGKDKIDIGDYLHQGHSMSVSENENGDAVVTVEDKSYPGFGEQQPYTVEGGTITLKGVSKEEFEQSDGLLRS